MSVSGFSFDELINCVRFYLGKRFGTDEFELQTAMLSADAAHSLLGVDGGGPAIKTLTGGPDAGSSLFVARAISGPARTNKQSGSGQEGAAGVSSVLLLLDPVTGRPRGSRAANVGFGLVPDISSAVGMSVEDLKVATVMTTGLTDPPARLRPRR